MIINDIQNIQLIESEVPCMPELVSFLKELDLNQAHGVIEMDGLKAIFMHFDEPDKGSDTDKLEFHRKYIDLHLTLEGEDHIVFPAENSEITPTMEFNQADDYGFVSCNKLARKTIPAGTFCLIPTELPHMALYAGHRVKRKVVFKLPTT